MSNFIFVSLVVNPEQMRQTDGAMIAYERFLAKFLVSNTAELVNLIYRKPQ